MKKVLTALFLVAGSIDAKVLPKEAKDVANLMRNKTVIKCLENLEMEKGATFLIGQVSMDSKNESPLNLILEGSLLQDGDVTIGEATVDISGPFDPNTNTYDFTCTIKK